ncbi:hypothetical protein OG481_02300 [Streptomyces longwoodensis]|uniref:hypothetical protein n=1 Tax=Streptomyces longwoodensis TaxID=68231 RepID=UPI002DDB0939|nr:hypothetical protein [Streptomyces longwoodensis]WRY87425.1 hypothetical protein OG481_02300 [Streptomyces longwoodensis]
MNTAVTITAITAALILGLTIVTATRDVAQTKHGATATAVAHCTVEQCTTTGTLANPGGDWTRDQKGRHFCPNHPAAISCRICGGDKGTNLVICGPCARSTSKESHS